MRLPDTAFSLQSRWRLNCEGQENTSCIRCLMSLLSLRLLFWKHRLYAHYLPLRYGLLQQGSCVLRLVRYTSSAQLGLIALKETFEVCQHLQTFLIPIQLQCWRHQDLAHDQQLMFGQPAHFPIPSCFDLSFASSFHGHVESSTVARRVFHDREDSAMAVPAGREHTTVYTCHTCLYLVCTLEQQAGPNQRQKRQPLAYRQRAIS